MGAAADLRLWREAHRTAWETFLITVAATHFRRKSLSPFSVEKLDASMQGGFAHESQNTPGEDTQFELYVAASLILGGLEVTRGEPDLRMRYGYEWIGIAAKRVRSDASSQLQKHIKKALEQIRRSGLRGFVALNLDRRFRDIDPELPEDQVFQAFRDRFDLADEARDAFEHDPYALGYLAFGYHTLWRPPDPERSRPRLVFFTPRRWRTWARDPGEHLLFRDLYSGWADRLDTRMDLLTEATWSGML